jgi:hypothetical protein
MTLEPHIDVMALRLIAGQNARTTPENLGISVTYGAYVQVIGHVADDDSGPQNCQGATNTVNQLDAR